MPKSKADMMCAGRQARKDRGLTCSVAVHIRPEQLNALIEYVESQLGGECPIRKPKVAIDTKFVKIAHYVEKSFDDNPSFIIEMRDGVEYISNGCVFVERTDKNITQLIEEYDCEPELNELLVADAIEMRDVVDTSFMFDGAQKTTKFSSDISNVVDEVTK